MEVHRATLAPLSWRLRIYGSISFSTSVQLYFVLGVMLLSCLLFLCQQLYPASRTHTSYGHAFLNFFWLWDSYIYLISQTQFLKQFWGIYILNWQNKMLLYQKKTYIFFLNDDQGAREMTQCLGILAVPVDQRTVLSTHTEQLTACNFISRGYDALF